jgi:hypothetical protein
MSSNSELLGRKWDVILGSCPFSLQQQSINGFLTLKIFLYSFLSCPCYFQSELTDVSLGTDATFFSCLSLVPENFSHSIDLFPSQNKKIFHPIRCDKLSRLTHYATAQIELKANMPAPLKPRSSNSIQPAASFEVTVSISQTSKPSELEFKLQRCVRQVIPRSALDDKLVNSNGRPTKPTFGP